MIYELLTGALEFVFGNVEGIGLVVALLIGANYLSKGTIVVYIFKYGRVLALVLAAGILLGVLEIHVDALASLLSTGVELLNGVIPTW